MAATILSPFFFIFIHFLIIPCVVQSFHSLHPHTNNASDEQALMAFKSAMEYDQNNTFMTWTSNVSFCKWNGVTCSLRRQRVISLNLSSVGLVGTISPSLGNLSFLRILDLSNNNLHGHIPYQLGSLSRLRRLIFSSNRLAGSLPASLSTCHSLIGLSLDENHLTGDIPPELAFLQNLNVINLIGNNLTGRIPNTFGNMSSLRDLVLQENSLEGHIPWELGMLPNLSKLYLDFNNLTGEIPSSLSNCTRLQVFSAVNNYFSGGIPGDLCSKNTLLKDLYLGGNRLSGRIPIELFNCSQLQVLALWVNELSGVVPTEMGKLQGLTRLTLGSNYFVSGSTTSLPILTALINCSRLELMSIAYNNLTGVIPSSVGQLSTKLEELYLNFNQISGNIPPQIGNLTNLTLLELRGNLLTGAIPPTVGMLQRLEDLGLGMNNLEGNIPMEIGKLKSLGTLVLQENKLSGKIPDSLAHLQQIRDLFLHDNQLTGNIPASLGECLTLELLDLSYNRFHGYIPPQVAGLPNLAFYLNLSNNLLQGPLPSEFSKMNKVLAIDISRNRLTSHIPNAIGSCIALEYLNISSNELEGPIPDSLGNLQNLQNLDLSINNLSGTIPKSLGELKVLQHLNFSSNKLSGDVPKKGVFKNLGATSFIGNLGLCGSWVNLPPCPALEHKSHRHLKRVFIPLWITIFIIWCVLMGFFWRHYCKRRHMTSQPFEVGPQRISFQELLTASDGFNEANLLGVGSFGKVYKGVLRDGTMVAIKVLNLENEDVAKSFKRECDVLSRVRHRNLLRIITSYSDPDFKALIFPLVPSGSLDKLLYPVDEQSSHEQVCSLDLTQRVSIVMDIAQGMEYLHHHCFVQVIHCDLKPTNVLLGENMTAYLTDFGISKVCFGNFEDSCTSASKLKGSIGYIAPEYGVSGSVTTKGDVYSYGILLLEMLTRKKPTNSMFVEGMNLQKWVGGSFPHKIEGVIDIQLLSVATNNDEDEVLNCLKQLICVGLLCTKELPEERPSMIDIVKILQGIKTRFLGAAPTPTLQSDLSLLIASTSGVNDESQSSSSF